MPEITKVTNEEDYDAALARISELLDAEYGTPESRELDRISDLVEQYEAEHYQMPESHPHSLLEFMLDQQMVTRSELIPLAGDEASLDAMLGGLNAIPPKMAQLLGDRSGVPAEDFLKTPTQVVASAVP